MPVSVQIFNLNHAAAAMADDDVRHIYIGGPPGVGKTQAAFIIAEMLGLPAWKWQLHAESSPPEGFGMYVPYEGGFRWTPGPIDMAYSTPGILILDELPEASGPVKTALYGALDEGRGGVMTWVDKIFTPKPGYKVIATGNTWPDDGSLPEALLDRFDACFIITQPGEKQLATLDPDMREMCEDAYATAKDRMLGPALTFRVFRSFQRLRRLLPQDVAALAACRGNEKLAQSFLEVLALADPIELPPPPPAGKVRVKSKTKAPLAVIAEQEQGLGQEQKVIWRHKIVAAPECDPTCVSCQEGDHDDCGVGCHDEDGENDA